MGRYSFTARGPGDERRSAVVEAESLPSLAASLAADGLTIERVQELQGDSPRLRGVPFFEIIAVYRQIASSLEAGLPLFETLQMLSNESRNGQLKSLLYFLRRQVAEGIPLSEAMQSFPNIFPAVHVAVVRAGEESGSLSTALDNLADQSESFSNMSRRFASALVYPTVIGVAALAMLNFGFLSVVPRFSDLYKDLGITQYGGLSRFMFGSAKFMLPATILLGMALLILLVIVVSQRKAAAGRLWLDQWKLRIPVVGQIVEKASLARFSGMLGMLLTAGVELPKAVRLASTGAGNATVEHMLKNLSSNVELGSTLGESMSRTESMPAALAWRVGVGEETGSLPDALLRMSRLYAQQVDSLVTSLAGILEPVLIVVIGTGVAMLVLGMFLPVANLISALTGGSDF